MANVINEIKSAIGAGGRPSKFRVTLTFPSAVNTTGNLRNVDTLAKSASFPALTIGQIEVWNQGRKLVIPGDTSFSNSWTVTFYNTEAHDIRRDFIAWVASCDQFQDNKHTGVPAELMIDANVIQLDSYGNETTKYTFHNLFPYEIGEISLSADTIDSIEEFDVTFSFTDWVVGDDAVQRPGQSGEGTKNVTALE